MIVIHIPYVTYTDSSQFSSIVTLPSKLLTLHFILTLHYCFFTIIVTLPKNVIKN